MKPANAAVIGYGYAGRAFHTYLIGLAPSLRLHAVVARDPEKREQARRERGCRVYSEVDQVLTDPEVDLVVLATPNPLHCELALRALQAGKHVVTDKPMCLTLEECDRMIAAAQAAGRLLAVFQNRRWDGDFLTLRKLQAEGALGRLRWLEMAWQGAHPCRNWRSQAAQGGGRFFDLGAHLLDQMLLLLPGRVTSVHCRMHHDDPTTDTETHALLTLGFEDGATGVIDTGSMHWISKPRFYACGDQSAFLKHGLDPQEKAMNEGDIDAAVEPEATWGLLKSKDGERRIPTLPGRWRAFYGMIGDLIAGRAPAEAPVRLEESRRVMAVFDAALASARSGQVVSGIFL
jgi:predicted dehydrogenase